MYNWVKGELHDMEAVKNAIKMRMDIVSATNEMIITKMSILSEVDSLSMGRLTPTTMFKN